MSRYLLLLLLNLPFIVLAIIGTITRYKLKHATRQKTVMQLLLWLFILVGLASAQGIYEWLLQHRYTDTDSLSLFDVIQITAIVVIFYIVTRLRAKNDALEQRLNRLHREISIRLSEK